MSGFYVIGIDPGQTTGIATLDTRHDAPRIEFAQVTPGLVVEMIGNLLYQYHPSLIAVERFVIGPRASRSRTPKAGQVTRQLVVQVIDYAAQLGVASVARSASEVKPWATDARLRRAGLYIDGMGHARDAARHLLFAACHELGYPDPLSRSARSPSTTRGGP